MKLLVTGIVLFISFSLIAQDSLVIPKGVVYKKTSTDINTKARALLLQELNAKTVTYALSEGAVFIGPRLWNRYKTNEAIGKIKEGNVQFRVPVTDPVTKKQSLEILTGKLLQNKEDFKTVWKQIVTDVGTAVPVIRKVNEKELSYYWAIINFDIEEPVYVVETANFNLLVQFIAAKMNIYWLEEMPSP
jgi:hypothetical protein